jgi:hypothetical protein
MLAWLLGVQLPEGGVVLEGVEDLGDDLALGIHLGIPGELGCGVPLLALGLLVEVAQPLLHAPVVPDVVGVEGGEDGVELAVDLLDRVDRGGGHGSSWRRRVARRSRAGLSVERNVNLRGSGVNGNPTSVSDSLPRTPCLR